MPLGSYDRPLGIEIQNLPAVRIQRNKDHVCTAWLRLHDYMGVVIANGRMDDADVLGH